MPTFKRKDSSIIHSVLQETFRSRYLQDVEICLSSNIKSRIQINSSILSLAFPWLKPDLENHQDIFIILIDDNLNQTCLDQFSKLLHFGEVQVANDQLLEETRQLCDFFKASLTTFEDDLHEDMMNEDSITDQVEVDKMLAKKQKRVFTANLSSLDLTCSTCHKSFSGMLVIPFYPKKAIISLKAPYFNKT